MYLFQQTSQQAPTFTSTLTPYLAAITPATLVVIAWRARGFLDKLVNNHLAHFKQDIINAVQDGVKAESEGRTEIVQAVRDGNDRIVNTLLLIKK